MLETILLGKCLNINPYNQPAVELIKKETKKDFHTVQVLVQYNKPLYFDQDIEIGVKVKEIGNSSMTWIMGMFLKEAGDLVSSCEAVHVYTDQTTMKPTPITDELKAKLKFN